MTKAKIVIFGSINFDLFADIKRIPFPGETLESENFRTGYGGKGANQAVAAARLTETMEVEMVGRVGDDYFGKLLLGNFHENNIGYSRVTVASEESSGVAIILIDSDAQNYILPIYGPNLNLGQHEIESAFQLLPSTKVLLTQQEVPIETTLAVAKIATSLGVVVIHDPAPTKEGCTDLLPYVDFILPNQVEAQGISGIKVTDVKTAELAALAIKDLGARSVIIKLGGNGCYVDSHGIQNHFPAPVVHPINTAGAGDVFAGAFAIAIAENMDVTQAITFANKAAAISVTKDGIQESMPTRNELNQWPSQQFTNKY